MRPLITLIILICTAVTAFAQNAGKTDPSLKFDRRYTQCERKWVVISPRDTDKSYLFGFIYIDAQAGFTFDMKGTFTIDDSNHYIVDTSLSTKQSIKYRIARNWRHVALVPPSRFTQLHIKPQPNWIKIYYDYTDTVQHNYRWGFIYNDLDQCDTALVYLEKAYKINPHYHGLEFELIFAYNALKRYDDAIGIINSALKNDPQNVMFYRELGYAYLQKMDYDKSITTYTRGIGMCTDKQNDTKAEMAINMAKAYKLMGKPDEYAAWGAKAKAWAPPGSAIYKSIVGLGF